MSWTAVCKLSDLGDDTALGVEIGDKPVCVARSEGVVYALYDVCSHAEIALSEGEVEDGTIECWLHGSAFDLATGKPTGLPATKAVPTYAVRVDGDEVFVDITNSSLPSLEQHA
jgi:3-phenylpropionate/trans-cinnamate dioxygenase ferredoxin component